jgi:hypothetical protein
MHILGNPFNRIDWDFLARLATDKTPESITHDYKGRFPDSRDAEGKARFLKSASAFANTSGGIFVFGIDTSTEPWTIGLTSLDEDKDVLSLQNLMRSGVDPSLHYVEPAKIEGHDGQKILLLAIPRSLAAPHELNENYGGGYWRRNQRGNYPMGVTELRRAFEESDRWRLDALQFLDERISFVKEGALEAGLTGASGGGAQGLFFHLLPLGRLGELVDTSALLSFAEKRVLGWAGEGGAIMRPNVDGWVWFRSIDGERRHMQLFRNGAFEYYADLTLYKARSDLSYLEGGWLDAGLVTIAEKAFDWARSVELTGPFVLSIRLLGATKLGVRYGSRGVLTRGFDRHTIAPPVIVIDESPENLAGALRPILDSLWLAAGARSDPHFDAEGKWTPSGDAFQFQPV